MASTLRNPRSSNERPNTTTAVNAGNFGAQPAASVPQGDKRMAFKPSKSPVVSRKSSAR